jgi:hypothetical protein
MTKQVTSSEFLRQQFEVLIGAYGWPEKPGEFAAWVTWLAELPKTDIGTIVMAAPERWPGKMPTVGTLRLAIQQEMRRRLNAIQAKAEAEKPEPEYRGPPDRMVPAPFLELAKSWQQETEASGRVNEQPPHEIKMQRIRELSKTWATHTKIKDLDGDPVGLDTKPKQQRNLAQ